MAQRQNRSHGHISPDVTSWHHKEKEKEKRKAGGGGRVLGGYVQVKPPQTTRHEIKCFKHTSQTTALSLCFCPQNKHRHFYNYFPGNDLVKADEQEEMGSSEGHVEPAGHRRAVASPGAGGYRQTTSCGCAVPSKEKVRLFRCASCVLTG